MYFLEGKASLFSFPVYCLCLCLRTGKHYETALSTQTVPCVWCVRVRLHCKNITSLTLLCQKTQICASQWYICLNLGKDATQSLVPFPSCKHIHVWIKCNPVSVAVWLRESVSIATFSSMMDCKTPMCQHTQMHTHTPAQTCMHTHLFHLFTHKQSNTPIHTYSRPSRRTSLYLMTWST